MILIQSTLEMFNKKPVHFRPTETRAVDAMRKRSCNVESYPRGNIYQAISLWNVAIFQVI